MSLNKTFIRLLSSFIALFLAGILAFAALVLYFLPQLPATEDIMQIQLSVPLRIYAANSELIAEYGEKRRLPIAIKDTPQNLLNAILASEDANFYQHGGVSFTGILRAILANFRSGEHGQGASTITMQVARNYFLTREKTYTRKFKEVLLAFKLEKQLEKQQILELYINKIFLGHRSYGFGAAAQVYYGKPVTELGLAQLAMLAGLPKAPSSNNPISNPVRALNRRNYVLGRMLKLNYITRDQYENALTIPVTAKKHATKPDLHAPYIAAMVRDYMVKNYGEEKTYSAGYNVYTTINADFQRAANQALFKGLVTYDERHGFRGPIGHAIVDTSSDKDSLNQQLSEYQSVGELVPAIVLGTKNDIIGAYTKQEKIVEIKKENYSWARKYKDANTLGSKPKTASDIVTAGDIVYLRQNKETEWQLSQLPTVEGALVSLRPYDGAILALSGGFNFFASKFNRATQARRQPGSNIKPFIYSAALDNGFSPASLISGAPVVVRDGSLGNAWRPENYSRKFFGLTRMREALKRSLNLVSIRLLRSIGVEKARKYLQRFGFKAKYLPQNLSLALGTASLLPIEVARAYAVFANGGFLIEPYFVDRIEDSAHNIIFQADALTSCKLCPTPVELAPAVKYDENFSEFTDRGTPITSGSEINPVENSGSAATEPQTEDRKVPDHAPWAISRENAFLMTSMLQEVIRSGTGRKAKSLGRSDIAGKTGTTNDQQDAWFSGFGPGVETTVYIGFDTPAPMGRREVGGRAALPVWIDYMKVALKGIPEKLIDIPVGIVPAYIDKKTGKRVSEDHPGAMLEYFMVGQEPESGDRTLGNPLNPEEQTGEELPEDIL
ncbi:penicillin-binding protein 1A [bacterium BMS3Bbin11]|nr:penicillin-binding protein 1A [bacterium BMS3Abin11]GBE46087.1 penicillin-binding protein 1A [bacterium BMS3Bbin11]GMT39941.1 MAG: penicillin-binding protein 1A [bacterium]